MAMLFVVVLYPPLPAVLHYWIEYIKRRSKTRLTVPGTETTATLTHLDTNSTYQIRVRAENRYSYCNQYANGEYSESVHDKLSGALEQVAWLRLYCV